MLITKEVFVMICPYCGKEMTLGYIYGERSRIKWISKEDDQGIVLTWLSKGIILTDFVENKLGKFIIVKMMKYL